MSCTRVYHELHPFEVRVVRLLPGQWLDEIRCELQHASLASKSVYKALSYAWGSPKVLRRILLDGGEHFITVNLACALRRLRNSDHVITLWVDALSINQSDNDERTSQVSLMRDIYTYAEEVIVYLGEAHSSNSFTKRPLKTTSPAIFHYDDRDEEKLKAFRSRYTADELMESPTAMRKIDFASEVFCLLRFLGSELEDISQFNSDSLSDINARYQRNLFEELRQMMRCSWWNRIWVIQEVVVPKKVIFIYGSVVAPWDMLVYAALFYSQKANSPALSSFPREYATVLDLFTRMTLDLHQMRELWRTGEQTSLVSLLRQFSGRGATDDRDKVYALLGLVRDGMKLFPDYSLDVSEVFRATALDIIVGTRSLGVLAGDLGRKNRKDLPSWVPDWSAIFDNDDRRRAESAEKYNATNGSRVYVRGRAAFDYLKHDRRGIEYHTGLSYSKTLDAVFTSHVNKLDMKFIMQSTLRLPGSFVDSVAVTGEVNLSNRPSSSVLQSWAKLVADYFEYKDYDITKDSLGDAFLKTLCADMTFCYAKSESSGCRRLGPDDMSAVAAWFLGGEKSPFPRGVWDRKVIQLLFGDLARIESMMDTKPNTKIDTAGVDAAVRLATSRRTFFITSGGCMGLGPASMRTGDYLYILLGGRMPFILRDACRMVLTDEDSEARVSVRGSYLVGDCYAHGIMNGEAMDKWVANTISWLSGTTSRQSEESLSEILKREQEQRGEEAHTNWWGKPQETRDIVREKDIFVFLV